MIGLVRWHGAIACVLASACSFDTSTQASGSGGDDAGPGGSDGGIADTGPPAIDSSTADPRKSITVAGGTTVQDLNNFPLYVSLSNDTDLRDDAQADGGDIFFEASNGAALDYEIETWDKGTGSLTAWVRVPSITMAAGVVIYLRYGNAAIATPPNPAGVWANGFLTVWHMGDDPASGAASAIVDSLGVRHGTADTSMTSGDVVAGALGNALDFDGGDDVVLFDNPLLGSSSHTIGTPATTSRTRAGSFCTGPTTACRTTRAASSSTVCSPTGPFRIWATKAHKEVAGALATRRERLAATWGSTASSTRCGSPPHFAPLVG
jgi:hypothetical protein